ncbi:MAG: glycosyltransferase [Nitrospira sp.]|nr:glycosyltransferase [Nitrospira sp.]
MTKLMMVIHSLRGGGSEKVLLNLLKGLDRNEFFITLILYERVFDFPLPENVEVKILDIYTSRNILKLTKSFILKIVNLSRLIRQNKPDIVFSLLSSTNVAAIVAKLFSWTKCKVIVSDHTHPSTNLKNEIYGGITKIFIKYLYPKANKIIAVSEGIKQDLIKNFNIPEDKVVVIYNPVDIKEIETLSKEKADHPWFYEEVPIIVSVGRITKQKGYPYLIKAFSLVKRSLTCRLLIIGEGEDKMELIEMTKELDLKGDIEFLGFQKNPFKYMARSSVFILSSLYEGFGNVIVEAMALGLPVISTDCPSGPSEIIDDRKNGLLVPIKDERALAKAMIDALTDSRLKDDLCREAKLKAQSYDLNKIIERYRSIFYENSSSSL